MREKKKKKERETKYVEGTHRAKEGYVILLGATLAVGHPVGTSSRNLTSSHRSSPLCRVIFLSRTDSHSPAHRPQPR